MAELAKIEYYDLKLEALHNRLPEVIGRAEDLQRMSRIISGQLNNNCLVVGPAGIGKTVLTHGWIKQMIRQNQSTKMNFIQLEAESFYGLSSPTAGPLLNRFQEALDDLPPSVLLIDDFGSIVQNKPAMFQIMTRLLKPLLKKVQVPVVLLLQPHEYRWIENEDLSFLAFFETITLKNQEEDAQVQILQSTLGKLNQRLDAQDEILKMIIKYVERFPVLGQLPRAAIKLLDESLAHGLAHGRSQLIEADVQAVVADKTGVPVKRLKTDELELLKNLEAELNERIVGQKPAIYKFATTIQKAKLGLRNPNRPLGSFLLLGPSGVGKTETAKLLAEKVFGKKESFVRIDMSEFGQEHAVQRLIGAPPGYVGYEAGGSLTNAVKAEPFSLVLLDELEKANSKIFDIFLQVLDDGRLTSGQGDTVDFRQTIIVATSNLAVPEIIDAFQKKLDTHSPGFQQRYLVPILTQAFRPEFLNRFDSIVVFNPLAVPELVKIAQLEMRKIEERVSSHKIKFNVDPQVLAQQIQTMADLRFGARPVKRFVEEVCENLIVQALLKKSKG